MSNLSRSSLVRRGAQIVAAMLALLVQPARAEDASAWVKDMHSSVRLIAASATPHAGGKTFRAGIEISLDPNWKTYWRYPGDSGVPPRFSFTRSENVQAVTVEWPAPHRFTDGGGQSIGYKDHVIFPLVIVPKDASQPVRLRVDLDYAVCEKLCIPADAKVEIVSDGKPTANDALLAAAAARVPQQRQIGEHSSVSLRAVKHESDRILVDVEAPDGASVDLFAEGPTPDWALPLPEAVAGAPAGLKRFAFALDGLPPGASFEGATLTLTTVAGDNAIEVRWPVH